MYSTTYGKRILALAAVTMMFLVVAASNAGASPIVMDFSNAAQFAVLGLNSSVTETIHDPGQINGNVGVPHKGQIQIGGGRVTNGTIYFVDPITTSNCDPTCYTLPRAQNATLVNNAISEVNNASTAIHAAAANQTFSTLSGNQTFTASGENNVIRITGSADFKDDKLTLSGTASQYFYFDIGQNLTLNNVVLTGGIDPTHVFFNVLGTGSNVFLSQNNANFFGYFLVTKGEAHITGSPNSPNGLTGGVFGGGSNLTIDTEANINAPSTSVPEPGSLLLLVSGLGFVGLWKRNPARTVR